MADHVEISFEYMAFKSTLDRLANDLRNLVAPSYSGGAVAVAEVEDSTQFEAVLKGAKAAVVYRLRGFKAYPRKPRFAIEFSVGIKVREDNANLLMTLLVNHTSAVFAQEARFDVYNYVDQVILPNKVGNAYITSSAIAAQEFDKEQGLRFVNCRAVAVIYHADQSPY